MKIYTLAEKNRRKGTAFLPDEGLSLYFEHGKRRILFDTGATDAFIFNATLLGIDLSKVDACIISHAHAHHAGGLPNFLEINSHATVYMKSETRGDFYVRKPFRMEHYGIDPELFHKYSDRIRLIDDDTEIFDGVTAADIRNHRKPPIFTTLLYERHGDEFVHDSLAHELYLAVRTASGTVVLTGCSHNGVINILQCAEDKFGTISGIAGGFHLDGARRFGMRYRAEPASEIRAIAKYLYDHRIKRIYTGFCTGREPLEKLELLTPTLRLYAGDVVDV
jgi:7,8-dihydropterin-6-yl-methyl-4-(beta-D-ribofuranosyl)aminobenzene 5'-phosphate synthase